MSDRVKLIVDEKVDDLPGLPKVSSLRLNFNGRKHKRGKNHYKKRLGQFRRTLRW